MGKVFCEACRKKCKGQAVKLHQDKYFHLKCFKCKECNKQLSASNFFSKDNFQYCLEDYQKLFATRCHGCGKSVEGEVVTALGNTFHQECLHCTKCLKNFGAGDKITFNGNEYLCHVCLIRTVSPSSPVKNGIDENIRESTSPPLTSSTPARPQQIALNPGQLNSPDSDYSMDIKDYMKNGHCIEDQNMLSPISVTSGYKSDTSYEQQVDDKGHLSPSMNFMQYRSTSPGSTISRSSRKSKDSNGSIGSRRGEVNYGKFYKMSYLDRKDDYKKGPSINPKIQEKPPLHYHRPEGFSYRKIRTDILKPAKKGSRHFLTSPNRRTTEPYKPVKSQEPIQLSKLPDAHLSEKNRPLPIERDDFPGPPDPAAAYPELLREHRFRHRSGSRERAPSRGERPLSRGERPLSRGERAPSRGENKENEMNGIEVDYDDEDEEEVKVDPKIEKEIQELSKLPESGAAKMILEDLRRKKLEPVLLDPRSASRTPSAATEPPYKTRYESPMFASPSRDLELRAHIHSLDDTFAEQKYRTCSTPVAHYLVPRPGYGLLKSSTLDSRNGYLTDTSADVFCHTPSYPRRPGSSAAVLEHSSYYSQSDDEDYDPTTGLRKKSRMRSAVLADGRVTPLPYLGPRRSVPSIFKTEEPQRIYTYDQLRLSSTSRPTAIDNGRLEQYLCKEEFESIFHMSPEEFYHLAEWKRNDMKMRVELF